jgi:hypothetical protein
MVEASISTWPSASRVSARSGASRPGASSVIQSPPKTSVRTLPRCSLVTQARAFVSAMSLS